MSSNKYCQFCGADNAAVNQFCANCGADLGASPTAQTPAAVAPTQQPVYAQPTTTVYTAPAAQSSSKGIAGFVIGIIGLVVLSWLSWTFISIWILSVGLVLTIVGLVLSAQGMKEQNKVFGTIGLVFNIITLLSIIGAIIFYILFFVLHFGF